MNMVEKLWWIMLRWAKMYAYSKVEKIQEDKHCICKRTEKCVVAKSLTFDDFKTSLFDGRTVHREKMLFETKKHIVETCASR